MDRIVDEVNLICINLPVHHRLDAPDDQFGKETEAPIFVYLFLKNSEGNGCNSAHLFGIQQSPFPLKHESCIGYLNKLEAY